MPTLTRAVIVRQSCRRRGQAWRRARRRRRMCRWRWRGASWRGASWASWPSAGWWMPVARSRRVGAGKWVSEQAGWRCGTCAIGSAALWHFGAPAPACRLMCAPLLQLYIDKAVLEAGQPGGFAELKALVDSGDIVGARGSLRRTEKGELSVVVTSLEVRRGGWGPENLPKNASGRSLSQTQGTTQHSRGEREQRDERLPLPPPQVLTKSLLPLPDKWHGLTDVEARYRRRYLDMIVTPGVVDTLKARRWALMPSRAWDSCRGWEIRVGMRAQGGPDSCGPRCSLVPASMWPRRWGRPERRRPGPCSRNAPAAQQGHQHHQAHAGGPGIPGGGDAGAAPPLLHSGRFCTKDCLLFSLVPTGLPAPLPPPPPPSLLAPRGAALCAARCSRRRRAAPMRAPL